MKASLHNQGNINCLGILPTRARFRKIHEIINDHFCPWREEYKNVINALMQSAKEENCEVTEMRFSEFPENVR